MRSKTGKRFVSSRMNPCMNTYENFQNQRRWFNGKYERGYIFEMLETILKVAGMVVNALSTIEKVIELVYKFKHQKSNHPSAKE